MGTTSSLALGRVLITRLQRLLSDPHRTPTQLSASSAIRQSYITLRTSSFGTRRLIILLYVCLGSVASMCSAHSFTVTASFAQSSFPSFPSISDTFSFLEEQKMAYFTHDQLIPLLLANEAYSLPPTLLWHVMNGTLDNDELEELSDKLNPA